jgi:large subunit ribosomal protein L9e
MIIGVTEGFRYKMRLVHAHFPIQALISKDKKQIEIKNFLGGKKGHLINLQPGCTVFKSTDTQHEIVFDGTDIGALSLCCAQVSQVCKVGRKDERKFLDGIFVSEKTLTNPKED